MPLPRPTSVLFRRLLSYPLLLIALAIVFAWVQHRLNIDLCHHGPAYYRPAFYTAVPATALVLLNDLLLLPYLWQPKRKPYYWLATLAAVLLVSRIPLVCSSHCGYLPELYGWLLLVTSMIGAGYLLWRRPRQAQPIGMAGAGALGTELKYLRDQVNPHFLFNTLNSIYALARERSEQTPEVVSQLSTLLRYQMDSAQVEKVTLRQELDFIQDYLLLEDTRLGDRCRIEFELSREPARYLIHPMLLLPFVENAFKHGANASRGKSWIRVTAEVAGGELTFRVENSRGQERPMATTGTGLANVRRRLELLYPDTHSLQIVTDQNHQHSAILSLQLHARP